MKDRNEREKQRKCLFNVFFFCLYSATLYTSENEARIFLRDENVILHENSARDIIIIKFVFDVVVDTITRVSRVSKQMMILNLYVVELFRGKFFG
jgi:hypothetical protein